MLFYQKMLGSSYGPVSPVFTSLFHIQNPLWDCGMRNSDCGLNQKSKFKTSYGIAECPIAECGLNKKNEDKCLSQRPQGSQR